MLASRGSPSNRLRKQADDPSPFLHQTGDQIVEVNGIDFSNLDHKEVRCGFFTCWSQSSLPSSSHPLPLATVFETRALQSPGLLWSVRPQLTVFLSPQAVNVLKSSRSLTISIVAGAVSPE